jgi:hypothetical protein
MSQPVNLKSLAGVFAVVALSLTHLSPPCFELSPAAVAHPPTRPLVIALLTFAVRATAQLDAARQVGTSVSPHVPHSDNQQDADKDPAGSVEPQARVE